MRPVCERGSRKLHRLEFPCESWLVAGKQRPVDKGFGNLGLSHLHSGCPWSRDRASMSLGFSSCRVDSFSHMGAILSLCSDV